MELAARMWKKCFFGEIRGTHVLIFEDQDRQISLEICGSP